MSQYDTNSREISEPYERTASARAAIDTHDARRKARAPSPRLKVSKTAVANVLSIDHPDLETGQLLLMRALGTTDPHFLEDFLRQLGRATGQGPDADESALNFMLAVVKGIEPKDQVEAMLGAQMAAVHMATMTFVRRLAHVENIQQQDSAERAFNKLARTFAVQLEALKRYRTGGEQKVTVKHVTVHEGGQAIVGNVSSGGRANEKACEQAHAKVVADASQPSLRSADKE